MLQAPQEEISTLSSTSCRAWISADPFAVWAQGSPSVRSVPTPRITAVSFLSWRASLQVLPILLLLLLFATWCLLGNDVPLKSPFPGLQNPAFCRHGVLTGPAVSKEFHTEYWYFIIEMNRASWCFHFLWDEALGMGPTFFHSGVFD